MPNGSLRQSADSRPEELQRELDRLYKLNSEALLSLTILT